MLLEVLKQRVGLGFSDALSIASVLVYLYQQLRCLLVFQQAHHLFVLFVLLVRTPIHEDAIPSCPAAGQPLQDELQLRVALESTTTPLPSNYSLPRFFGLVDPLFDIETHIGLLDLSNDKGLLILQLCGDKAAEV